MEITETAQLALSPEEAWRKIGDFGAVGDWHPMLAKVDSQGNERGNLRRATGKDGSARDRAAGARLHGDIPDRVCQRRPSDCHLVGDLRTSGCR
jgi:Polyketide cyclase / dehydrase and lipid transport